MAAKSFTAILYDNSDPRRVVARVRVPNAYDLVLFDNRYFLAYGYEEGKTEYPFYEAKVFAATNGDVL